MCTGLEIMAIAGTAMSVASATGIIGPGSKGGGNAAAPAVTAPPQAARTPDQAEARRQGAPSAGSASTTMLTGPGGVAPDLLSLGKNTLLGS